MKKLISILLCLTIIISASAPITVLADGGIITITQEQMSTNAYKAIENALKQAKTVASSGSPLTVKLPSGTYNLTNCLHIFSNTVLELKNDTVLVKKFESGNMLKLGTENEVNYGYDGYKNITISGGVWDCNYTGTSCIMRFAHCKNINLVNATLTHQKNAHHMEIAAAKDFNIYNCTFSDYSKTTTGDGEALQIDPMHSSYHFPAYEAYDDTPCKNILVDNCTFSNLYAGVGTRSGIVGSYFENIKITNNTFHNIKDRAICAFNYRNSTIKNNTISNATIGIIFEYFPYSNLLTKLYMPNSSVASTNIIQDSKSSITNNTIYVKNSNSAGNSSGIAVYGGQLLSDYASRIGLKAGNYLVEGLKLSKNIITVESGSASGIIIEKVNRSSIKSNKIISTVKSSSSGIYVNDCDNNNFESNKVQNFVNGVNCISSSKLNSFKKNTLSNNSDYGLSVDNSSYERIYYGNKVKNNGKGVYFLKAKNYTTLSKTIKLRVKKTKKKNTLTWNMIKGVTGYRIYRSKKKNSGYTLYKTVKGKKKTTFTDKKVKGKKYYYKIEAYKSANKTKIYGKQSNAA